MRSELERAMSCWRRYAFKDALAEIGIRVVCFEHIPALERLRRSFADYLDRQGEHGGADRR